MSGILSSFATFNFVPEEWPRLDQHKTILQPSCTILMCYRMYFLPRLNHILISKTLNGCSPRIPLYCVLKLVQTKHFFVSNHRNSYMVIGALNSAIVCKEEVCPKKSGYPNTCPPLQVCKCILCPHEVCDFCFVNTMEEQYWNSIDSSNK